MDIINTLFALASIVIGAFGWLAPKYTLETLNLTAHTDTMGTSEIRASVGCLFVGMGIGALTLGSAAAFALLGFCWGGAAFGRLTSTILDGATRKKWMFFGIEAAVGLVAIVGNV